VFQGDKDAAQRDNKIAIGVMSVGAAGAIVGGVLLYMNRGRTVYEEQPAAQVGFVPARDGGGVMTLSGRW
jgi:hypothetical protein